jgi:hypothetical protein
MPRFTIKDLLLTTTLIAVGVGMFAFLFQRGDAINRVGAGAAALLLWFGGSAFLGAGVFAPFKRPWRGAIVAVVLQALVLAVGFIAFALGG